MTEHRDDLKAFQTLLSQFQLQIVLYNRRFCKRGIRNVVQKKVDPHAKKYFTFDGKKWNVAPIRMNARQLKEQKQGILSGCVEGCNAKD